MIARTLWLAIAGVLLVAGTVVAASVETDMNTDGTTGLRFRWGQHAAPFHVGEDGAVEGAYVRFQADAANGTLVGYTAVREAGAKEIFARVTLDAGAATYATKAKGAGFALYGGDAALVAFDARNAGLYAAARHGANVTLVLADGIDATWHAGDPGWSAEGVLLRAGNATARLVVHGEGSHVALENGTITVTLGEKGRMEMGIEGHPGERAAEHRVLEAMRERLARR